MNQHKETILLGMKIMSDGICQNQDIRYEDTAIMATEDILNILDLNVDSYWYLNLIHYAAIIKE